MRLPIGAQARKLARHVIAVLTVGLVAALAAPALVATAGNGTDLVADGGAESDCEATGASFELAAKTPGGTVAEGTYNIPGGGTITIENGAPGTINFVSTVPVAAIFVKKGNLQDAVTVFDPPVLEGTANTNAPLDGEASPSHITFCFGSEAPPPPPPPPPPDGDGAPGQPGAATAVVGVARFTG
jgi:hypothetical protein